MFNLVTLALFDPWKTANRIPLTLLVEPLAIAGVSALLFRELAFFSFLGGVPLGVVGAIAALRFFIFVSAVPAWLGYGIWKTLNDGADNVGLKKPTLFLRISRRTMTATYIAYLIVVVLYLIDLVPSFKSNFNLFAGTSSGFLITWAYTYPWPLIFEIFPVISLSAGHQRNPFGMAKISVLSGLEEEQSPFVDDSIKHLNRVLRRWHVRIKDEASLSTVFYAQPTTRRVTLGRLGRAVDDRDIRDYINVLSSLLQKAPEEILERTTIARMLRAHSTEISIILAIGVLVLTFILTWPIIGALFPF